MDAEILSVRPLGRRFFTLIELLVVVAIISILASMLLPVLSRAKAFAESSVCASNLKQVYMGYQTYADEYDDYMPNSRFFGDGWQGKIGSTGIWGTTVDETRVWADYTTLPTAARPSYKVLECPGEIPYYKGTGGVAAGMSFTRYRHGYFRSSYNQHYSLSNGSNVKVRKGFSGGPTTGHDTAEALLNGDASTNNSQAYFYTEMNATSPGAVHAYRHPSQKANFAYWDGHVGTKQLGDKAVFVFYFPLGAFP